LRTAVFGRRIEFAYRGLNPKAAYKARLRFFSDNKRELLVKTGQGDLLAALTLSKDQASEHDVMILGQRMRQAGWRWYSSGSADQMPSYLT
jgi:hypothetical protein